MRLLLLPALSSWLLGVVLCTPASACFQPPPTRIRSVLPIDGAVGIPTNARPRVTYSTGPYAERRCGAPPAEPLLRAAISDGGSPGDGGAAAVPGSWVLATDDDPRNGTQWEFRSASPLRPRTTYELLDGSAANCDCLVLPACPERPLAVFAQFTTGDGPDVTPPTFSGLLDGYCLHATCGANDLTCCGPYDHLSLRLMPAADDRDQFLVGVRYYARKEGGAFDFTHAVGPGQINSPVDSESTIRWDLPLTNGRWFVIARAFDLSGNEDGNLVEAAFTIPLANDPACARALFDGGPPRPDLMLPGLPDGTSMYPPDLAAAIQVGGGGCGCAIGAPRAPGREGPDPDRGQALGLCGAVALLTFRLRRGGRRAR